MTKYREIIRLASLNLSQTNIALSCGVSKKTVNKVLKAAREKGISWPLDPNQTDAVIEQLLFPKKNGLQSQSNRRMPDYAHIRKELLRNGVNKKLLWTEYLEECRLSGDEPLMYSQFCYYIQQDEQKRRATMHINRKPAEQIEVDWAGDPAHIIDPDTGEILDAHIFLTKGEELLITQCCSDPCGNITYTALGIGLVFWSPNAGWDNRSAIVFCHFLINSIDTLIFPALIVIHSSMAVVRHENLSNTAKILVHVNMCSDP